MPESKSKWIAETIKAAKMADPEEIQELAEELRRMSEGIFVILNIVRK